MKNIVNPKNLSFVLLVFSFLMFIVALYLFTHRPETAKLQAKKSPEALIVDDSQNQELQKFNLTGFDNEGKRFWNLEGETAKIDPGQTVYLDQNVTLKLREDTVIRTDHVQWSQDGGTLKTDAPVVVDHQNVKIKGLGAVGRPSDSFIQINRNVRMVINPATTLTCKGPMKIFYKENKIVFYRQVKVVDEKGTLTSNRMDVFFDSNEKKISQIVAVGNVIIQRGTDTTRSARAVYSVETGSIRLEGNPEVTIHKEGSKLLDGAFRNPHS